MLKAEPLTVLEVNTYGVGHINRYTSESIETAYDQNGYGGMAYYTSETCGFPIGSYTYAGCITDYSQSEIKYVVDAWASDKTSDAIEYRLIKIDELIANLGCTSTACDIVKYSWLHSNRYWYWTMSPKEQATALILFIGSGGVYTTNGVNSGRGSVRPVITISNN